MAWIKSHQELRDHPKTRKLAHILGISRPAAIGHLQCLWWWALDYAEDGSLGKFDSLDIALGADWEGDETLFVSSLVRVGFIDQDEDGYLYVHDWDDYAGTLIRRREANTKRMQDARAQHVRAHTSARAQHVREPEKRREEKSREEESREPTTSAAPPDAGFDERFDEFWNAYPKKAGKQPALKAFKKINWRKVYFADVMAALERHKQSAQWTKDDGQFVPNATTWLNQARWEDDLKPPSHSSPQSPPQMTTAQRLAEQARREREEYEQARSNGSVGDPGDGMARETDNGRDSPSLFLVPGQRTG